MKRLKTALSAVLALSMALGMAVVPAGAADGTYQNAVYPERICRAKVDPKDIRIKQNNLFVTGQVTVAIPTDDEPHEDTYTAELFDGKGEQIQDKITYSLELWSSKVQVSEDENSGVAFRREVSEAKEASWVMSVSKDAKAGQTYCLKAECNGLLDELEIVLISAEGPEEETPIITWSSTAAGTYGQTWNEMVDISGCTATLNGAELPGRFEVVDSDTVPDVGGQYRLKFTSADGRYTETSEAFSAKIEPKPLIITAKSAEKVYDGQPLENDSYTAGELANGDVITEVTVSGTLTNVGEAKNVPSDAKISGNGADKTENYAITYVNGTLKVTPRDIADVQIELRQSSFEYSETEHNPKPIVAINGKTLENGVDYELSYANNKYCGTGTVTITGKELHRKKLRNRSKLRRKRRLRTRIIELHCLQTWHTTANLVKRLSGRKQALARSRFTTTTARLYRLKPEPTM